MQLLTLQFFSAQKLHEASIISIFVIFIRRIIARENSHTFFFSWFVLANKSKALGPSAVHTAQWSQGCQKWVITQEKCQNLPKAWPNLPKLVKKWPKSKLGQFKAKFLNLYWQNLHPLYKNCDHCALWYTFPFYNCKNATNYCHSHHSTSTKKICKLHRKSVQ